MPGIVSEGDRPRGFRAVGASISEKSAALLRLVGDPNGRGLEPPPEPQPEPPQDAA